MRDYTTDEQSKKLLELGLNPKSANMFWKGYKTDYRTGFVPKNICWKTDVDIEKDIVCWSSGALLNLMPNVIITEDQKRWYFDLYHTAIQEWGIRYEYDENEWLDDFTNKNLIDACYEMMVWLLENKYVK